MNDQSMQLVLKNARYYQNGTFLQGDIWVSEGKIRAIMACGAGEPYPQGQVLDVEGLTVLPGLFDTHVHFREPGYTQREGFFSGSMAAAAGGITAYFDMPNVMPPTNTAQTLQDRIALAEQSSVVDFNFYAALGYDNLDQLPELAKGGQVGFKTFLQAPPVGKEVEFKGMTAQDDGQLYWLIKQAAKHKKRCFFHCENHFVIAQMEEYLRKTGQTENNFHYLSRPNVAEVQSVATVIQFAKAQDAKVGISHVSVTQAAQLIREAKAQGVDIVAETCYQYLTFDSSKIDLLGSYAKCNPPLRSKEDVEGLWEYINDGTISLMGSDHAPFLEEDKKMGDAPIWQAKSGLAGIEVLVPIMLTHVAENKLSLEKLVQLMSENPAKIFGLYPQKGTIAEGSDADFTIVNLNEKFSPDITKMVTKGRQNNLLFDGLKLQGRPRYTIVRGKIVMAEGLVDATCKGYGKFVRA